MGDPAVDRDSTYTASLACLGVSPPRLPLSISGRTTARQAGQCILGGELSEPCCCGGLLQAASSERLGVGFDLRDRHPNFCSEDRPKIFCMDPVKDRCFRGVVLCGTFGRRRYLNPLSSLAWCLDQLIEREGRVNTCGKGRVHQGVPALKRRRGVASRCGGA